jgi:hypothetical protein
MDREGTLAPETPAEAREQYASLVPTAKVVTREAAKAMEFDRAEYDDRVTADVIASVRDALFASLLAVHVGDRAEFDHWRDDHPEYEPVITGSDDARRVVWHAPPFADRVVAATFNDEHEAAVGTLRRQAFGRLYREHLDEDAGEGGEDVGEGGEAAEDGSEEDEG